MDKEAQALFPDKIKEQAEANIKRYGDQDPITLLVVAQIQMGHVTEAYFRGNISDKFRVELVHLAAVLYELYGK